MTEYQGADPLADRWVAGSSRALTLSVGDARTALLQAVRALGFVTTREQFSLIEAERGSRLRGFSLTRTRVPVSVRLAITPEGNGCRLEVRVEDRWGATARTRAAVPVYAEVFTEVLSGLDEVLRRADPSAAASFGYWWRNLPEVQDSVSGSAAGAAARVEDLVQRRTSRLLDGPRKGPSAAVAGAGVQTVTFTSPDHVAAIGADVVDGMLTAGQLVAASPGAMPPDLVAHVQAIVVALEERLAELNRHRAPGGLTLDLSAADRPVITFLYQQAALRDRLPVRLLMSCTTCRLEKVVNPDFVRLRERNRRVKVLSSSVGAVFGSHNVSPFILVGRLAQVKKSDPEFVCLRCQGTDADEKPITFCPRCGDRLAASVLRNCPKCELDLRTLLPQLTVWTELPAAAASIPAIETASVNGRSSEPVDETAALPPPLEGAATAPTAAPKPEPAGPQDEPVAVTAADVVPTPSPVAAAWYPDPWRRFEIRYWDGRQWTIHVGTGGTTFIDAGPR